MWLSDFDYELPRERIALRPLAERDASRMLALDRARQTWEDHQFRELPDLLRGDELLVVNNARVMPARLFGRRKGVHAGPVARRGRARREFLQSSIEVLLTRQLAPDVWEALVRPGRKMRTGEQVLFGGGELEAEVIGRGQFGVRRLRFYGHEEPSRVLERLGHVPLPPYIDRPEEPEDRERYQTIFARKNGAVAAPTAGLHFTSAILNRLRVRGVELCEINLQVGLGTFQPIHVDRVEDHRMPSEPCEIPEAAAAQIEQARSKGRPILAVGTTVVRALEDCAEKRGARAFSSPRIVPGKAEAEIFIYPGHTFRLVDQVLTNFHLPRSTLLVMVSAFAGRKFLLRAYAHAVEQKYRFYSYGDCMLIR
jgi:S-adenosylmethionine:tRNA ribosyltransferase-isomerase